MREYVENGVRVLEPDDGKYLTNGDTYSTKVYLGKNASENEWTEVNEIPPEPIDDAINSDDAMTILMGGE